MSKIKLGLVNINNSFSNQDYFPYSVGILQAYAQEHASNIDEFEFITPIYKRTGIEKALEKLSGAGIVFFSVYVWNFRLSLEIARKLKQANQDIIIVFGGPHVPWSGTEKFMRANVFIDLACRGEGERAIVSILENYDKKDWGKVPSASFIDNNGSYNQTQLFERISDLEQIPSPYLEGVFGELIRSNQDTRWVALWETNRGCPFTCT
ncbi:MAG: cobalamin B12-binding domain-containing protein, partial [Candidatus Vogelbacteria bacterium]|nr:cobalamin B12-binding domain-containing protein [Candidatus Vogelbacteria bacterium]